MAYFDHHFDASEAAAPQLEREVLRALRREELAIARRFQGGPGWAYGILALAGFSLWLGLGVLVLSRPVGLGGLATVSLFASALATYGYITAHEAMHGNIGRAGSGLRWLNDLAGWLSVLPIVIPFSVARITHLRHHSHCNDPVEDPDFCDAAPDAGAALIKTWLNRQPGVNGSAANYRRVLVALGTAEARAALGHAAIYQLGYHAVLFAMAWSGHALEALAWLWLPRQVALSTIRFFLSWAPHHPRESRARYANTVVRKSRAGFVLSLMCDYHLVHHLYPHMLIHRNPAAFRALRGVLEARGVDCSAQG